MALVMISSLTFRLPTLEHTFGTCVNLLKGKLSKEICISDQETLIITHLRLIYMHQGCNLPVHKVFSKR